VSEELRNLQKRGEGEIVQSTKLFGSIESLSDEEFKNGLSSLIGTRGGWKSCGKGGGHGFIDWRRCSLRLVR
jgi:hypothetical protein